MELGRIHLYKACTINKITMTGKPSTMYTING